MKIFYSSMIKYLIYFLLFLSYSCQNCLIKLHNFYLIPIVKEEENSDNSYGLHKYNYNLILETNPLNPSDNFIMMFLISFPINVNIELSPEIIYKFESTRKFCLKDLTKESIGRQTNIQGKLSEYNSEIQILERIWIKIEKVLLYKTIDSYEKKNKYYLLTEFYEKDKNKKFLLMKKMSKNIEKQFFQIVRINIDIKLQNKDCSNEESHLNIGTEFTIQEINQGDDSMLREGINYEAYSIESSGVQSYNFKNIENLICLIYENQNYGNKCFTSSTNSNNKKKKIWNNIDNNNVDKDIIDEKGDYNIKKGIINDNNCNYFKVLI